MKMVYESPTILEEERNELELSYLIPYVSYGRNGYFLLPPRTVPSEINWERLSQTWKIRARELGIKESDVQNWVDEYRAKKNV